MKKLKNQSGFTLIELLVALVILICLVIGIGVGMDAGSRIYSDAIFEADSANLAGILNTAVGDILRYSEGVQENTDKLEDSVGGYVMKDTAPFVFTSYDYGIQNAYFVTNSTTGVVQLKNLNNEHTVELINTGAYPDLMIKDFKVTYEKAVKDATTGAVTSGGYFIATYEIHSTTDTDKVRNVEYIVRRMNN